MGWVAIDLHMHTVEGITRDGSKDQVNFDYMKFVSVLIKYDLKLIAITNHNILDFENYVAVNYLGTLLNSKVLPGIELDTTMDSGKPLHLVAIFKDDFRENLKFSNEINNNTKEKKKQVIYTHEEVVKIIRNYNTIIIPHGNKSKGIFEEATEENINEALKKVREGFIRVFDSMSDWNLERIKAFLAEMEESDLDQFGGVLFSDIRNWDKYDEKYRAFKMNALPTFKGLIHATSNPTKRFAKDSSINYNTNYISKIEFKTKEETGKIKSGTIELDRGYNCIIGKSGSGKSLLIEMLKRKLIPDYVDNKTYEFANQTEVHIFNDSIDEVDFKNINATVGENLYDKIIKAYTTNDSEDKYQIIKLLNKEFVSRKKFLEEKEKFIEKITSYRDNRNKYKTRKEEVKVHINSFSADVKELKKLKDTRMFSMKQLQDVEQLYSDEDIDNFQKVFNHFDDLKGGLELYKGIFKTTIDNKLNDLKSYIEFAHMEMKFIKLKESNDSKKIEMINRIIQSINSKISTQSKRKSELIKNINESTISIISKIKSNYKLNLSIKNVDLSFSIENFNSITEINKKHDIDVVERINSKDILEFDIRENVLFNTHGNKQKIKSKIFNLSTSADAKQVIDKYIELNIINDSKISLKDDFDVEVIIRFAGQDISQMNPGDIAKTYISVYFELEVTKSEYSVVLFDQIENDVDKEFISNTLKELIENTKGNIQLIVVTHDPIIAVNADPNNYIEALKNKDFIEYRSFRAESDERNELKTIANNVDGSIDVIRRRYEIYEGERK